MKTRRQLTPGLLSRCLLALILFTPLSLSAQDFVWAPDYPVGSEFAEISAPDQDGNVRDFYDLVGENGLLFMFSRSFDW